MSFKYINPGFAELFSSHVYIATEKNSTYNPKNNFSIKGLVNNSYAMSDYLTFDYIPAEIYAKFDLSLTESERFDYDHNGFMFRSSRTENRTGLNIYKNIDSYTYTPTIRLVYNNTNFDTGLTVDLTSKKICSIWFHVKMKTSETDSDGLVEASIDNGKTIISKNFNDVANFYNKNFYVYARTNMRYSNIIISDEYIDPREQIIKLPISSTESDMTFDSGTGIYTATATNQSLLSAVNVNALAEEYGGDSQVTGVALVGNPAYKTAEGLSSLTAFSKDSSGNVTNYGTYALGSESSGVIADSQILTGKTIAK